MRGYSVSCYNPVKRPIKIKGSHVRYDNVCETMWNGCVVTYQKSLTGNIKWPSNSDISDDWRYTLFYLSLSKSTSISPSLPKCSFSYNHAYMIRYNTTGSFQKFNAKCNTDMDQLVVLVKNKCHLLIDFQNYFTITLGVCSMSVDFNCTLSVYLHYLVKYKASKRWNQLPSSLKEFFSSSISAEH